MIGIRLFQFLRYRRFAARFWSAPVLWRFGLPTFLSKAPEDWRTPRRSRVLEAASNSWSQCLPPHFTSMALLLAAVLLASPAAVGSSANVRELSKPDRWFQYTNHVIDDIPWSIHIVKLERSSHDFEFVTTLGKGDVLGMGIVSDQIKTLPHDLGQPIAAINGDFYDKTEKYLGRPRDVQIRLSEVVTSPSGHTCFWIDAQGAPQMTNIYSRFSVTWANGINTPIELNQARADDAAVLYTPAIGPSTRTSGGIELVLWSATNTSGLPLPIVRTYLAQLKQIRNSGDTSVNRGTMVLSLGPGLVARIPHLEPGATLRISTETHPDLSRAKVAIGGGPALVQGGKAMHWSGFIHMR